MSIKCSEDRGTEAPDILRELRRISFMPAAVDSWHPVSWHVDGREEVLTRFFSRRVPDWSKKASVLVAMEGLLNR